MLPRQSNDNTMGRWSLPYRLPNIKHSCDQQLGFFTQDPGNPGSFTQDPGGRKCGYFPQKVNIATHHRIRVKTHDIWTIL